MANKKAAIKDLRQNKKKQLINKAVKNNIKKLIKDSRKEVEVKSAKAQELVKSSIKAIDKAVKKGVLKKNAGNRKKSRLMKRLNAKFEVGKKNK